ncbi:MAG: phosphotransferase [Planctomycetes bacterium]|nr:phosphotransferase [Planctomycetota bacterium]
MFGAQTSIDGELPARLGDRDLVAPTESEVLALGARHLGLEGAAAAICTHARWKRGVSLATSWSVRSPAGAAAQVVIKRYTGSKVADLASRPPLEGQAVLTAERTLAWRVPADRELSGLARIFDRHRTTRLLHRIGALGPWVARWASSDLELVRYKPEHRAVVLLDLDLRFGHKRGEKSRGFLAARVLRPDHALRVAARRRALAEVLPQGPWPVCLGGEPRTGLLFESWIAGTSVGRDDFTLGRETGGLFSVLHGAALASDLPGDDDSAAATGAPAVPWDLLESSASLAELARRIPLPRGRRRCWTHGDVHPDQVLLTSGSGEPRLLDFDNLGPGDPHADLASWIADRLAGEPGLGLNEAAGEFLEGYGLPVEGNDLREHLAAALAGLAAGCLRRLQPGAVERARALLERATELSRSPAWTP